METLVFPSIIPIERVSEADVELSMLDFEALVRADQTSKAALDTPFAMDVATNAIELLEESLFWLDHVAQTLRRRVHHLTALKNGRLNLTAPIARLPPELIRAVFEYHADEHRVERNSYFDRNYDKGHWLALGSVCRYWRLNLFDTPNVWANDLFFFNHEKVSNVLPLAQDVPLNIELHGSFRGVYARYGEVYNGVDYIKKLSHLFPRAWRIMSQPCEEDDALALLDILCSEPLLKLQSVCIEYYDEEAAGRLPLKTMANHPNLQFLSFTGMFLRPSAHGGLLSLDIDLEACYYEMDDDIPLPMNSTILLEVLAQNPSLRVLKLCCSFEDKILNASATSRVHLSNLTNLTLRHFGSRSVDLLDHLWLPAVRIISIRDICTYDSTSIMRVLTAILMAWSSRLSDAPLHSLRVIIHHDILPATISRATTSALGEYLASHNEHFETGVRLLKERVDSQEAEFVFHDL